MTWEKRWNCNKIKKGYGRKELVAIRYVKKKLGSEI